MRALVGLFALAGVLTLAAPARAGGFGVPEMNVDECAIDDMTLRLLALRQPMGRDLRFAMLAVKVVTDGADGYYPTVRPTRAMAVIPMLVATYEAIPDKLYLAASTYVTNATGAAFAKDAVTQFVNTPEQHVYVLSDTFRRKRFADEFDEFFIPAAGER